MVPVVKINVEMYRRIKELNLCFQKLVSGELHIFGRFPRRGFEQGTKECLKEVPRPDEKAVKFEFVMTTALSRACIPITLLQIYIDSLLIFLFNTHYGMDLRMLTCPLLIRFVKQHRHSSWPSCVGLVQTAGSVL